MDAAVACWSSLFLCVFVCRAVSNRGFPELFSCGLYVVKLREDVVIMDDIINAFIEIKNMKTFIGGRQGWAPTAGVYLPVQRSLGLSRGCKSKMCVRTRWKCCFCHLEQLGQVSSLTAPMGFVYPAVDNEPYLNVNLTGSLWSVWAGPGSPQGCRDPCRSPRGHTVTVTTVAEEGSPSRCWRAADAG